MSTREYDLRPRRFVPPPRKTRVDDIPLTDGIWDDGTGTYVDTRPGPNVPVLSEAAQPQAPPVIPSPVTNNPILEPPKPVVGAATTQSQYQIEPTPSVSPDIAGVSPQTQDPTAYVQPTAQETRPRIVDPHAVSARTPDGGYNIEPSRPRRVEGQPVRTPYPMSSAERLGHRENELAERQTTPYRKESRLKSALKMLAAGLGQSYQRHGAARDWGEFANMMAAGGGAALAGAIDPTLHDKLVERPYELERLGASVKTMRDSEARKEKSANAESIIAKREFDQQYKIDKLALERDWKSFQVKTAGLKMSMAERRQKFIEEQSKIGNVRKDSIFQWQKEREERINEDRDASREQRQKQFERRMTVMERNATTAETRAANAAGGSKIAGYEAKAQYYEDQADEIELEAQQAEDDDELDQALELHKQANSMRRQAATARGGAIQRGATAPPTGIMTQEQAQEYADSHADWDQAKRDRYMVEWALKAGKASISKSKPAAEGRQ